MAGSYWDKVVNKEDFDDLRPVINRKEIRQDITNNDGKEEIIYEIEQEEQREKMIMDDFDNSQDEFISDDY